MTTDIEIESLRPALAEIERFIEWMNGDMTITAKVVPVISKGYKKNAAACFSESAWATREGEEVHELMLAAEGLKREPTEILESVVHEMVHLFAHTRGIKDCATSGRHNKRFQTLAKDYGLVCEKVEGRGFAQTSLGNVLAERIKKEFKPDVAAFNLFRLIPPVKEKKKSVSIKWMCKCEKPYIIRSNVEVSATCNICNNFFEKEEA